LLLFSTAVGRRGGFQPGELIALHLGNAFSGADYASQSRTPGGWLTGVNRVVVTAWD
jgi:hypothetical protein